jgi:hypothetical protein
MISLSILLSAECEDDILSYLKEGYYLEDAVGIAIQNHKKKKDLHHVFDEICNDGTVVISIDVEETK